MMMIGGVTKGMSVVETFYGGVGVGLTARITTGDIISTIGGTGATVIMIAGNYPTSYRGFSIYRGWPRTYSNCKHILLSMADAQSAPF